MHLHDSTQSNYPLIVGRPGNETVQLASQNVHLTKLDMALHAVVLVSTVTVDDNPSAKATCMNCMP